MDFGLGGVIQGDAEYERLAAEIGDIEKKDAKDASISKSFSIKGGVKRSGSYRQKTGPNMNGSTIDWRVVGRKDNPFYKTKSQLIEDVTLAGGSKSTSYGNPEPGRLTGLGAATLGGGAAAVGGGAGYAAGRRKKSRVAKRDVDPERKRQRRLENYQAGLTGGGLIAGTAGATSYAGRAKEGVKDARSYARNITLQRQKHAAPGAKVGRAGPGDVPIKHYGTAFKPTKGQAAAVLGGLGAVLAGDQIGRYRKDRGKSYRPIR